MLTAPPLRPRLYINVLLLISMLIDTSELLCIIFMAAPSAISFVSNFSGLELLYDGGRLSLIFPKWPLLLKTQLETLMLVLLVTSPIYTAPVTSHLSVAQRIYFNP